ncbi:MAG: J domain-containing protein [Candidatus Limnocylindria bacterium]
MAHHTMDPYAVLGVPRDATAQRVAQAFRRLAKQHHPDLHPDAVTSERMRRINQAWHILSNPARRARYDNRASRPWQPGSGGSPGPTGHWTASSRRTAPAAMATPSWHRTHPVAEGQRSLGDSRWAALLVSLAWMLLLLAAIYAGSQ